jgi:hypothetical protein
LKPHERSNSCEITSSVNRNNNNIIVNENQLDHTTSSANDAQLKYENERAAERYAEDTVKYSQFDSFKSSGTDLYNLAVGSLKHRQFPEMAFRRWLRQLVNDRDDRRQDYTMLTELESSLGISSSTLRSLRRISLDYNNSSHTQRKNFWTTLYRYFTQNLKNLDLIPLIPKI